MARRLPLMGAARAMGDARPQPRLVSGRVTALVVGGHDDAAALRFGAALAEALGAPLWRGPEVRGTEGLVIDPNAAASADVVAVGASLASVLDGRVLIGIGAGPRSTWRLQARTLPFDLELSEAREGLVPWLAERLAAG